MCFFMHKTTIWCLHRGIFPPTLTNRMTAEHMLGQTATLWRGSWRMLLLMSTDGADKRKRVSPHILGDGHDGRWLVGIMHHVVKKNERIGKGGEVCQSVSRQLAVTNAKPGGARLQVSCKWEAACCCALPETCQVCLPMTNNYYI